jgi:septin family protein
MYLPMTEENDTLEIKVQKFPNTLNLLLVGENGTGKSSLINILNNGKTAFESDIRTFKTNKINEYLISYKQSEINSIINQQHENNLNQNQQDRQFNYKICDTLGFSLENKELKDLIAFIKEYNEEQIRTKDRIHCILYFLNENKFTRILSDVIKEFFNYIYQKRIKVIFVINFNNGKKHVCRNKLKKNFRL